MAKNLKINIIDTLSKKLDKKQKESFDKEDLYGMTPLVLAIKKGWYKLAIDIIKAGFYRSDRVDEYTKLSPLHHSAQVNDEKFLMTLTKTFKHIINTKDKLGNTALHYAAFNRNKRYIEILIKEGANVKIKNKQQNTALHLACLNNDPHKDHSSKVEELLINNGADINAQNDKQETPLMLLFRTINEPDEEVCSNKFDPISSVMILIKAGADVTASTTSDMTPLHYA